MTASYWRLSQQLQRDNNDALATGAKAYFFDAGTTTPYTTYSDGALTAPNDHPLLADGYGRWPAVFIPYTATGIRERVTTSGGTQLWDVDDIPNVDPYNPAISVDPLQLITTGMTIWLPVAGTKTGFVRANGRTIGNAASGGSERANADTEDLFTFLWNGIADASAAVSTGRGASAAADFAANKTIALPDLRGGVMRGLDDMGNTAASLLDSAPFTNGSATAAGSLCGENTHALITAELAAHTHTGTTGTESANHTHTVSGSTGIESGTHTHPLNLLVDGSKATAGADITVAHDGGTNVSTATQSANHTHTFSATSGATSATHTHTFTSDSTGSGTAHNVVSQSVLGTFYIKL